MFPFSLPHADKLFKRYFDRWYSPADRQAKGFIATRPDMLAAPALVGGDAGSVSLLSPEDSAHALQQVASMLDAARGDWPTYLAVRDPIDIHWVEAFDAYYDKKQVKGLIARSAPHDFGNDYLVTACEFGSVLGHVLKQRLDRLEWVAAHPYWECSLLDPRTGNLIPVFHWAIKKLSSYGLDDGFGDKIEACLRLLDSESEGRA